MSGASLIFDGRAARHFRWPSSLAEGDTVGLFAPAGPFEREELERGAALLKSWGLKLKIPSGLSRRRGYLAGSDAHRLELLKSLMADDEVRALVAVRGGYGCQRLLPALAESWKSWPDKPLVGFSDLTALHLARLKAAGVIGFHGPMAVSLGKAEPVQRADEISRRELRAALLGRPFVSCWSFSPRQVLRAGRAEGPALGGNLSLLICLLAGPYLPSFKGAILFLEDVGECPYRLDRLLIALRQSPLWRQASGLVFGQFSDCGPPALKRRLLAEAAADFSGPVLWGAPFGHESRNRILPLGAWVELRAL